MKKLSLIPILILLLTGCFFKSVMEGEADDILKSKVFNYNGKDYLVMHEAVFQATYKESGRGISLTTGFNELRISVYNLEDGMLAARKATGKQINHPNQFLGFAGENLWFYSADEGLHALDPLTLETKITHKTICRNNPELEGKFATCEWYQYPQYYQLNEVSGNIVLTDNQGFRYNLDPKTLSAEKIIGEYRTFEPRVDRNLVESVSFPPPVIQLTGDLRKQIIVERKELNPELTFLDGKLIADRDPFRVSQILQNQLSGAMKQAEILYPRIMALNAMENGSGPRWGTALRDTLRKLEDARYRLERYIRELEECFTEISASGFSHKYTPLLSPDSTSFFVFHKASTAKDACVRLSRVDLTRTSVVREMWNIEIPGLFFDPSDARETNAFKEVFSKGDPEFGYSAFLLSGNKLVIVWMLHVYCVDVRNGNVMWFFRV